MANARDIAKDTDGDILFTAGMLTFETTGLASIAAHCKARLLMFSGEWFADLNEGTPWYESILVKTPRLDAIRAILRKRVQETPGVNNILSFEVAFDGLTRALTCTFAADTDFGALNLTVIR